MKFVRLELEGAWVVEIEPVRDERGWFARTWSRDDLAAKGLDTNLEQSSVSFNRRRGTLRGMHYQIAPHEETKLVRCTAGAIYDVIVDLRAESPTRGRWVSVELTAANHKTLYVPKGFAHGFQTLVDDSEVFYQISARYEPDAGRGVRWDDPSLAIRWPLPDPILSERDRCYPDFR